MGGRKRSATDAAPRKKQRCGEKTDAPRLTFPTWSMDGEQNNLATVEPYSQSGLDKLLLMLKSLLPDDEIQWGRLLRYQKMALQLSSMLSVYGVQQTNIDPAKPSDVYHLMSVEYQRKNFDDGTCYGRRVFLNSLIEPSPENLTITTPFQAIPLLSNRASIRRRVWHRSAVTG